MNLKLLTYSDRGELPRLRHIKARFQARLLMGAMLSRKAQGRGNDRIIAQGEPPWAFLRAAGDNAALPRRLGARLAI